VILRIPPSTACRWCNTTNTPPPATTSTTACWPVVTHAAATAQAHAIAGHRSRGHRRARPHAASSAQITWNDGKAAAPVCRWCSRSAHSAASSTWSTVIGRGVGAIGSTQ
jgi:hypothetical protein